MRIDKVLVSLSISSVVLNSCIAVVGPYLPSVAWEKGLTDLKLSYMFAYVEIPIFDFWKSWISLSNFV